MVIEQPGPTRTIVVTRTVQARERNTPYYVDLHLGAYQGFMSGVSSFALNLHSALAIGRGFPIADRLTFDIGLALQMTGVGGDNNSSTILFPGIRIQPRLRLALNENIDLAVFTGLGITLAVNATEDQCSRADECEHPILKNSATDTASLLGFEFGLIGRYILSNGIGFGLGLGLDYVLKDTLAGGQLLQSNLLRVIIALAGSYRF